MHSAFISLHRLTAPNTTCQVLLMKWNHHSGISWQLVSLQISIYFLNIHTFGFILFHAR